MAVPLLAPRYGGVVCFSLCRHVCLLAGCIADFTPVCTTELGRLSNLSGEFAARNCKVAALSVDDADSHRRWIGDINETQGANVEYPIIADSDRKIANLYGCVF